MQKISKEYLLEKVASYMPNLDKEVLAKACDFSKKAHGVQKRASGDPYYYHPLEVSIILAELRLDLSSIITGLLHDTVEDTEVTLQDIEIDFGTQVMSLVDGVTKLAKIEFQSENIRQAENFRKLLLAMSEDIRVLLVKLCDRLHNMRTLHFIKSPQKRQRIAHETMEVFAPLAERIGMQKIKNEMQDLAFAEMHPEIRESIVSRLEYLQSKSDDIIEKIVIEINEVLKDVVKAEVQGRVKTPCSIWRKMERKNINFEQLSDIMAFRIVTDNVQDCYLALFAIHNKYKVVPETFKDYISTPKENDYQSLHTVVIGPMQKFIEVQIRTKNMNEVAELGVAAHWSYKQNSDYNTDGKQFRWIRELLYIIENTTDPEDFLENTKLEMYDNQVFCFTPKGEILALPKGATPVDFAYEIHSSVGNHCAGAKINGLIVPLRTMLENGDQVEIITSENQNPSPAWERFVVTGKSKSELKKFIRQKRREEHIRLGKNLITQQLKSLIKGKITDKTIEPALKVLKRKKLESLYCAVGEGNIQVSQVVKALMSNKKIAKKKKSPLSFLNFTKTNKTTNSIPIIGLTPGVSIFFGDCCHPIPGDSIVGVNTVGKGTTIHTTDCEVLANFTNTPERLVAVSWGKDINDNGFVGQIRISLAHKPGSLAMVSNLIAKENADINNFRIIDRRPDFFDIIIDINVMGSKHLSNIIKTLKKDDNILSVERYKY